MMKLNTKEKRGMNRSGRMEMVTVGDERSANWFIANLLMVRFILFKLERRKKL